MQSTVVGYYLPKLSWDLTASATLSVAYLECTIVGPLEPRGDFHTPTVTGYTRMRYDP